MKRLLLGVGVGLALVGCANEWKTGGNIGGANRNGRTAGNIPGGIAVRAGDIAVAPSGTYFLTMKGSTLMLGGTREKSVDEARGVPRPDRLAFWGAGDGFYALSNEGGGQALVSWDRAAGAEKWRVKLDTKHRRLDVTQNRVIVAGQDLRILDAADGREIARYQGRSDIRDVDVIHGGAHILVTEDTRWDGAAPATTLSVRNTDDGTEESTTDTENCSDDVVVTEDESTAFLAPTLCQKDPVTVLSLDGNRVSVRQQMPGFGPVARAPNGVNTVVAFLDRDSQAPEGTTVPDAVKSSNQRYHLMFVDTKTLAYSTTPVGDHLPRYVFTPDGKSLLIDSPLDRLSHIRVMDVATREVREATGAPAKLNMFTISPDGAKAFISDQQLFSLDVGAAHVGQVGLSLPPDAVNMTADGVTLLVTQVTDRVVLFLDALRNRETGRAYY